MKRQVIIDRREIELIKLEYKSEIVQDGYTHFVWNGSCVIQKNRTIPYSMLVFITSFALLVTRSIAKMRTPVSVNLVFFVSVIAFDQRELI